MEDRSGRRACVRLRPLALGLALACGSAIASVDREALDAAIPTGLSAADREFFAQRIERFAARATPHVPANSIPVTNCDDSSAGSLRDAVDNAVDGDTIDLTALGCSTITLTSGAIAIGVDNLTIQGPSALLLTIDGGDNDRVFWHVGFGTLTIADVSVAHGRKYLRDGDAGNAAGGCVLSTGDVSFEYSWAKYCEAASNDANAPIRGGAIYAQNSLFVEGSSMTGSRADSAVTSPARGGGTYVPGNLLMIDSTVSGNFATTTGGGVEVGSGHGTPGGYASIKYSHITSNTQSPTGYVIGGDGRSARTRISSHRRPGARHRCGRIQPRGRDLRERVRLRTRRVRAQRATVPSRRSTVVHAA